MDADHHLPVPSRLDSAPEQRRRARKDAMRLHPASHAPSAEGLPGPPQDAQDDDAPSRWERLRLVLVRQGLTDEQARTEVARIGALKVWDDVAGQLRSHRASGRQTDAAVLAVALRSIQGVTLPLIRRPGDLPAATAAVRNARHRLHHNGSLLHRIHRGHPAFDRAERTLRDLESLLCPGLGTAA